MVDFQQRDTRRGIDSGDESEDSASAEPDDVDESDEADTDSRDHDEDEHDSHANHEHGDHEHGEHSHDEHSHGEHDQHEHSHDHHHAHDVEQIGIGIVTVSTSRTLDDDPSGDVIAAAVEDAGNEVVTRDLVPDDYDRVQSVVNALVGRGDVDVIVTTGGTGVTPDDVTVEAVRPLFDKELPGFGELFRRLSYDEIGTKVVGTRALGGIAEGVPVFCLPGSENAARLGVEEIIVPEAGHLAGLARRDEEDGEGESGEQNGSEKEAGEGEE